VAAQQAPHDLVRDAAVAGQVALIAAIVAAPILLAASYFGGARDRTTLVRAIGEVWRGK